MATKKRPAARKATKKKATRRRARRSFDECRIKPGQVLNPKGNNQYTYRRDAEETFARILRSARSDRKKGTVAEEILDIVVRMAQNKDRWALDRVLERMLPKIERFEQTEEADPERLAAELAILAAGR